MPGRMVERTSLNCPQTTSKCTFPAFQTMPRTVRRRQFALLNQRPSSRDEEMSCFLLCHFMYGGAAAHNRVKHLVLRPGFGTKRRNCSPGSCSPAVRIMSGHLEGWSAHRFLSSSSPARSVICSSGLVGCMQMPLRQMEINSRILEPFMAHQQLNGSQIGAGFQ